MAGPCQAESPRASTRMHACSTPLSFATTSRRRRQRLAARGPSLEPALAALAELDSARRRILPRVEALKREQQPGGRERRAGRSAPARTRPRCSRPAEQAPTQIKAARRRARGDRAAARRTSCCALPNLPHASVPVGKSAARQRRTCARAATPPAFDFTPKAHWDLGAALGILDFERAARMSRRALRGADRRRRAAGARADQLHARPAHARARLHRGASRRSWCRRAALTGTGNLPKFEQDLFKIAGDWDLFLIPTAEVPLTNLHRERDPRRPRAAAEVHRLHAVLPQRSRLVRRRRARPDPAAPVRQGRAREVHAPDQSYDELEALTANAEKVLQALGLPYRTVLLCTGDMGFASAKTYDIEVWLPSQNDVPRDLVVQQLRGVPGAPRRTSRSASRARGKAELRAHAERIRPRGRPHADRDPRELPAGGRLGDRARGAAPVHGRPRSDRAAHRPPLGVLAHLAGCDGCTAVALESSLRRAPAIAIPPAFAADVARRARLETPLETPHVRGVTVGVGSAGVLVGIVVAWLGLSGSSSGVVPAAVLLFSVRRSDCARGVDASRPRHPRALATLSA